MFGKGSSKRAEWEGVKEGEGVEEVGEAVKKVKGERALDAAVEERVVVQSVRSSCSLRQLTLSLCRRKYNL